MRNYCTHTGVCFSCLFLVGGSYVAGILAGTTNSAPTVTITWPRGGEPVTYPNALKIKAQASDDDGSVTQVQFFVETNLIGTATNPPFTVLWLVDPFTACDFCYMQLKAVAVDNLGARTESAPVSVHYSATRPPFTFLEILQPTNGTVLPSPASFDFSAELLGSSGESAPIEFFIGTDLVSRTGELAPLTATTPPSTITVSNLADGEYRLTVRSPYNLCTCDGRSTTIRVVKLGVQSPRLTQDGRFQFDVLTSFSNRQTIVEASSNLLDWSPISTNHPSSSTFTFVEPVPATNAHRFYRVVVPPE